MLDPAAKDRHDAALLHGTRRRPRIREVHTGRKALDEDVVVVVGVADEEVQLSCVPDAPEALALPHLHVRAAEIDRDRLHAIMGLGVSRIVNPRRVSPLQELRRQRAGRRRNHGELIDALDLSRVEGARLHGVLVSAGSGGDDDDGDERPGAEAGRGDDRPRSSVSRDTSRTPDSRNQRRRKSPGD